MYDYLKGQVTRVTPEYIVLEQQGIGWMLYTPNPFAFRTSASEQQIYVSLQVREDAQNLYGFNSLEQRELFKKLIQVSRHRSKRCACYFSERKSNFSHPGN